MNTIHYYGYYIAGNENLAIAIKDDDPKDCHYFTRDNNVNNDAFIRAQGWVYPGI